ncbi:MAG TPA: carboxypeptidase-like regulatory domain-containing protein, partial [Bacteroidetes bacterium]|nr:carboxypeptidase-like regulatory domain-containing protein [Candidatus Limimorpha avicola]
MNKFREIIACILIFMCSCLSAQNRTTIYGNVGVENANIRVLNTQYGTSSDVKGNYSFSIKSDK